jgi:hypothetical protein
MVGSEGEELDPRRRMYSSGGEGGDDDLEYSSEGGGNGSPGRTGSDYYEDDVYSEGDEGSEDPSGAEIVPHSYRPFAVDRPRPVDVWRARHEVEVVVKEVALYCNLSVSLRVVHVPCDDCSPKGSGPRK